MTKLFDLTGKVALLTGASKGMGFAMAKAMAEHGAKVVISSRHQEELNQAAETINKTVGVTCAYGIACNVGYKEQLQELVSKTRQIVGPIDIIVGNAGVNTHIGPMLNISDESYEKTMRVNVQSNLWLAQMAASDMIDKGNGSMIFTSSIGAFEGSDIIGAYSMSKLMLLGLVRNLAAEFGPQGIRANAICPGLIKTDFSQVLWDSPEIQQRIDNQIPLRRLGEPEDFSGVAVFLSSDASAYMTGQALTLCGGSNMWA
jgi:NAD(P)-dependent dehydrogenase (short-subunit alcohol dehydrogenase family)